MRSKTYSILLTIRYNYITESLAQIFYNYVRDIGLKGTIAHVIRLNLSPRKSLCLCCISRIILL